MDQSRKKLPPPAKPPVSAGGSGVNKNLNLRKGYLASSRSHCMYRGSTAPGSRSVGGHRYEVAAPENRLRRRQASKEIVRRALTPPSQRPSWRWRNFRPTPSRFSSMSVA
ncbi:hypothetical protein Pfo_014156 [Paulownia fortunei]|nr:hypothetical protein Pfo_014156 [Paulownia fortunei]